MPVAPQECVVLSLSTLGTLLILGVTSWQKNGTSILPFTKSSSLGVLSPLENSGRVIFQLISVPSAFLR
ncbi:unnamed protein product, partial [Clonostachys rhizophaga]